MLPIGSMFSMFYRSSVLLMHQMIMDDAFKVNPKGENDESLSWYNFCTVRESVWAYLKICAGGVGWTAKAITN